MIERLRQTMAIESLSPQERAQCERKIMLTEKLDHTLFTEWDPIGVHLLEDFDCEDEYHCYLPVIVDMVTEGASINEIADALYAFEESIVGDRKCRRRCYLAAARILDLDPTVDDQRDTSLADPCDACIGGKSLSDKVLCANNARQLTVHYLD